MSARIQAHMKMISDALGELCITRDTLSGMAVSYLDDPHFKECKAEFLNACESFFRCIDNAPQEGQ